MRNDDVGSSRDRNGRCGILNEILVLAFTGIELMTILIVFIGTCFVGGDSPVRFQRRAFRTPNEWLRQNVSEQRVIETGKERNDREIIQEREVAADDEKDLKGNEQRASDVTRSSRPKRKPRHDQFDEMVPGCFNLMKPMGREMQIAAKRIRDRLRFVVIV